MPTKTSNTAKDNTNASHKGKEKILKTANLAELTAKYPEAAEVLMDYGLHCVSCVAAGFDTIEMGAQLHGMTTEEIDEMVERVNEVIAHGE